MDETPRQLISETREPVPAAPGRPAREDYECRRCGSCNVFMATEPLAGRRMTKVTARRTKTDWAHFLNDIAERHPGAKRITLVMDNLNTHRPGALYEAFPPAEATRNDVCHRYETSRVPSIYQTCGHLRSARADMECCGNGHSPYREMRIAPDDSSAPSCASQVLKAFPRRLRSPLLASVDGGEQTTEPSRPRSGRTGNRRWAGDGITRLPNEHVPCAAMPINREPLVFHWCCPDGYNGAQQNLKSKFYFNISVSYRNIDLGRMEIGLFHRFPAADDNLSLRAPKVAVEAGRGQREPAGDDRADHRSGHGSGMRPDPSRSDGGDRDEHDEARTFGRDSTLPLDP